MCVSASCLGSEPDVAVYTEILTELEPALMERIIFDMVGDLSVGSLIPSRRSFSK